MQKLTRLINVRNTNEREPNYSNVAPWTSNDILINGILLEIHESIQTKIDTFNLTLKLFSLWVYYRFFNQWISIWYNYTRYICISPPSSDEVSIHIIQFNFPFGFTSKQVNVIAVRNTFVVYATRMSTEIDT